MQLSLEQMSILLFTIHVQHLLIIPCRRREDTGPLLMSFWYFFFLFLLVWSPCLQADRLRNVIILVCNELLLPLWIIRLWTPMRRNLGNSVNISLTEPRCSNHWTKNFKAVHDSQGTIWTENKYGWSYVCFRRGWFCVATGKLKTWHKMDMWLLLQICLWMLISHHWLNYYDLWNYKYVKWNWWLVCIQNQASSSFGPQYARYPLIVNCRMPQICICRW